MMIRQLLPVLLAILLTGCSSPDRKLLNQADSIIREHPDSAMTILKGIDRHRLHGDDLAFYALLYTQAQVESGIPVSSDSLMSIAYEKYGDKRGDKGIRSNFYLGEVYYQEGEKDAGGLKIRIKGFKESKWGGAKPLRYYLKAYDEAKRLDNDYWHARAAKRIRLHFCWIGDYYEGERYAREEIVYFKKAGRERDHRLAIIDHAALYEPQNNFDFEREDLDSLRAVLLKEEPIDSFLLERIDYEFRHMEEAMEKLKKKGYKFLSDEDMEDLIDHDMEGLLDKLEGYGGAIYPHKYSRDLKTEITETRRDYYDEITKQNAENAKLFQRLLWIAVIVSLTIIAILWRMFYFRDKARKAKMASDLESFISLKNASDRMAEERDETISHLKHELEERERQESTNNQIVRDLLTDRWRTLDMLCDELFDLGQSDAERKRVVRNIEKELKKVVSPQGVAETVGAVDRHMDGLVSRLREQCPFLKETDINFLGLIYAGFSVRAVCMFTGMEYQHFYVKKSRLMKRIQNSDAPDRDLFIDRMKRK